MHNSISIWALLLLKKEMKKQKHNFKTTKNGSQINYVLYGKRFLLFEKSHWLSMQVLSLNV